MLRIYFKPNCSTCQTALKLIGETTDEPLEKIAYLVETPTKEQLAEIVKMLGVEPEDLVRKKEPLYKEKYMGKKINGSRWLTILSKNPILIERPILVKNGKAIIGRPVEKIVTFLAKNKPKRKTSSKTNK